MNKKPVIVFDFDGTIADTLVLIIDIFKKLAPEYGFDKLDISMIEVLRNKSASEIIRYLKIPIYKVPFFIKRGLNEIKKNINIIQPIDGIAEALLNLKNEGYTLGILTSNSKENVNYFLEKNKLEFFDFIYSGSNIFSKSILFGRLMREKKIKSNEIIYVGDEVRDIEATNKSKIKIISVGWGLNTIEVLEKNNPNNVIYKPVELLDAIKRICQS